MASGYNPGAMPQLFRLFWLRETGCDTGTPLRAEDLEPEIQNPEVLGKLLELAGEDCGELLLRLPYIDRREWPKRREILGALAWERQGNVIFPVLPASLALRDTAASLALADPVWIQQPAGTDPRHFATWRKVSATLQRCLREWIFEEYFRDIARFDDREAAHTMMVYRAAWVCHSRSRGVFTYDLSDYPECRLTLTVATKMTGRSLQTILAGVEQRLLAAGLPQLARRYAPVWHQDLVAGVRKKPKGLLELLRAESAFIDAVVELGLDRTPFGVHRFSKTASQALRRVYGLDVRHLGARALEAATQVLEQQAAAKEEPVGAMVERK